MPFAQVDFAAAQIDQTVARAIILKGADEAPIISALLALAGATQESSPEFKWFEDGFTAERTQINNGGAAYDAATTALVVDNGALYKAGDVLFLETSTTGERVLVTAVATNTLTVTRGFGGTTAHASGVADDAYLRFAGNVRGEGSDAPAATHTAKTEYTNYCQHFKETVELTGRADRTPTKTESELAYQRMKAMKRLMISGDRALIWGVKNKTVVGADSRIAHTTDGFQKVLSLNTNINGAMTKIQFNAFARDVFRYTQGKKLLFAGSILHEAIHTLGENKLQTRQGDTAFGLRLTEVVTPAGVFDLIRNPTLDNGFGGMGIVIDPNHVRLRHTKGKLPQFNPIVQPSGGDRVAELAEMELGLEYGQESAHGIIRGVTAAA
jgi:hypothetical protein